MASVTFTPEEGWKELDAVADMQMFQVDPRQSLVDACIAVIRADEVPSAGEEGTVVLFGGDVVTASDMDQLGAGDNIYMHAIAPFVRVLVTETS